MRALAVAAIALLLTTLPAYAQDFSFQNESSYVDETRIMHVLGEVRNDSQSAATNVRITASFYDSQGNLLAEQTQAPKIRVINPGGVAPFETRYIDSATVSQVARYELAATGQEAESKPASLKILSASSRLDVLGLYFINVNARNDGSETATNPIVIATLYDKDGKVVAVGEALAEGGDRVTDLSPGQNAGFGVVVSERLQTYKAARFSLVADSDQYVSEAVTVEAAGVGVSSNKDFTGANSGCLIATAAFGSELAPQVQTLRNFRDGIALNTLAGSSFMAVFNGWYYSFSPQVADFERGQPWLKEAVRASVYPLLGILDLSTQVYGALAFNGEAAIIGAGLTASALIGLLYFAPLSAVLALQGRRRQWNIGRAKYVLVAAWASSLALLGAGELTGGALLMAGTALLVLSAISTVIIAVARAARL
ncbi:CFI-box-CTERM domain-containing protein [Nitrososphaera sp.]|uniref:CFI-box-CTERM domain-containing protein n=1 Tax=Nitrososphaera sp. TaxID=1971748 RepID=UPI003173073E